MNYIHLLQHHHLKATPQRIAIIEIMHHSGHINIDDLFKKVQHKFASISLATLYKNIHNMMNVSLIREVKLPGEKSKYEIEKAPHAHILCKCCAELKDIPFDPAALIQNSIDMTHYTADEVSIVVSGICPKCQISS